MKVWYAVAFDVSGCIAQWTGPLRYTRARQVAIAWERSEYVERARVQRWMPSLVEWNRA